MGYGYMFGMIGQKDLLYHTIVFFQVGRNSRFWALVWTKLILFLESKIKEKWL